MPFDPTIPQQNTEVDAPQMRSQLNALYDLITAQAAEIAALQTPLPTAVEILELIYNSGAGTMQVTYAPTGGDNATELTLLWWLEGSAVNRVALALPMQDVSVGATTGKTFWQTEVKNAAGATLLSGVLSYFLS